MKLVSRFSKRFGFLICVIDTSSNYAWVVTLKNKENVHISNIFLKNINYSAKKPRILQKIYLKKTIKDNDIEMCLIHNEGKSVFAERLIRTLKN